MNLVKSIHNNVDATTHHNRVADCIMSIIINKLNELPDDLPNNTTN